jgi:NAD(P)H-flavin reductase
VRLSLSIRDVLRATPRSRIVRLDLSGQRFDYAAGQAVLVGTPGNQRRRPYSIASAPEDARREGWLELLVGIDGDESPEADFVLEPHELVEIDGPFGTFTFPDNPTERCFVFIAGGTGIAPLRAMLRHALTIPHRNLGVFYSARTPADFAYETELRALAQTGQIVLRQTITRATGANWSGARGRIGPSALGELVHEPETLCFVCGPRALVEDVPKLLEELGVPRDRIRVEEWGAGLRSGGEPE